MAAPSSCELSPHLQGQRGSVRKVPLPRLYAPPGGLRVWEKPCRTDSQQEKPWLAQPLLSPSPEGTASSFPDIFQALPFTSFLYLSVLPLSGLR